MVFAGVDVVEEKKVREWSRLISWVAGYSCRVLDIDNDLLEQFIWYFISIPYASIYFQIPTSNNQHTPIHDPSTVGESPCFCKQSHSSVLHRTIPPPSYAQQQLRAQLVQTWPWAQHMKGLSSRWQF